MTDMRVYSMAAVKYFRDGDLVEDLTEDFKRTAESTIAPTPVVVDLVASPAALVAAIRNNHTSPFVRAQSVSQIWQSIRWANTYESLSTFVSDGPAIHAFEQTWRAYTLAGSRFVTGNSLMQLPISVSSPEGVPLSEVAIFNGRELVRHFALRNQTQNLYRTLLLDGYVHRNLILVVVDALGRRAMSNVARNWKPGVADNIAFCTDHINDCGRNLLSHGPASGHVAMVPSLNINEQGVTWDGGPPATLPLLMFGEGRPVLRSNAGDGTGQDTTRAEQTPMLEMADESALAVTSYNERMFSSRTQQVKNAWMSFGPLGGPTPLFDAILRFRQWLPPSVGTQVANQLGAAANEGSTVTLFRSELVFKKATPIAQAQIIVAQVSAGGSPSVSNWSIAFARTEDSTPQLMHIVNLLVPANRTDESYGLSATIETGGYFAAFSGSETAQASVYWNRGPPLVLQMRAPVMDSDDDVWARLVAAPDVGAVDAGQEICFELAQFGASLKSSVRNLSDILALDRYIQDPTGMVTKAGHREMGPSHAGILDFSLDNSSHVVELVFGQHPDPEMLLPVRVQRLQRRWTVGLQQLAGFTNGYFPYLTPPLYSELGVDAHNHSYVPIYTGRAPRTHVRIGHPVIAFGARVSELSIQATRLHVSNGSFVWHVAVNNPARHSITATMRAVFPDVGLATQTLTIAPGEHRVLS